MSGLAGAALKPIAEGTQIMIRQLNDRGGVNGHTVRLALYDDGGDPARHRALTQKAVEQDRVVAFVGNVEPLSGASKTDYINAKRVPVIGMTTGEQWAFTSPMYFPQASTGEMATRGFVRGAAQGFRARGKVRLGTLACQEAQTCEDGHRLTPAFAREEGMEVVYQGRASLAQPDFTAQCLAARNAGVEAFMVYMEQTALARLAASCARQDYRPLYGEVGPAALDRQKDDPNLDGLSTGSPVFPYFQSDTPATAEFQAAMHRYLPTASLSTGYSVGWTSGKLFERAATATPDPTTSEGILTGLWSIKNDDLGGITQPLTFVKDQPPSAMACWFPITVTNRQWISLDGFRRHSR